MGDSIASLSTPLICGVPPGPPGTPSKVIGSLDSIQIAWTAPTDNGGAPITNYLIKMDWSDGAGFVTVGNTGSGLVLTWTQTGLTSNSPYWFKVIAQNSVDYGQESIPTKIIAGIVPAQPGTPVLVSQIETQVAFRWTAPESIGEPPVIGY